ncbi:MAG: HDOD domain-containing protein [Planctomycetia bacterium]|nr:HDOD domain-containing protein [Planctomycetia bacterium]
MSAPVQPMDLDRLLQGQQLPALPQSAMRLLELSKNPDNGAGEYAVPIEADPALAAQVLKFINSSYFAFGREILSVKLAISLVGARAIKNFVLWTAVFSVMPNPKSGPFDLKCLRQDSLRRGLFTRAFAKLLGLKEAEDLFAAALLQDMAIPLLAKALPKEYGVLIEARCKRGFALAQLEEAVFGWNHGEAAARLVGQWNLPATFADLIRRHTMLETLVAESPGANAASIVALSSLLPSGVDSVWTQGAKFDDYYRRIGGECGQSPEELLEAVDHEFLEFAPVLHLEAPAATLADRYRETLQPVAT